MATAIIDYELRSHHKTEPPRVNDELEGKDMQFFWA